MTTTEDQIKFIIPLNKDTEKLYYDQRIIIDENISTEPRTWKISKVNRTSNKGLIMVTCAQTEFNSTIDAQDEDGIWWADLNVSNIAPTNYNDTPSSTNYIVLEYSAKPEVKIGGGYKKFTANVYDSSGTIQTKESGTWDYIIDGTSVKSLLIDENITDVNQVKIKFTGSSDYIGKVMTLQFTSVSGLVSTAEVEINRL